MAVAAVSNPTGVDANRTAILPEYRKSNPHVLRIHVHEFPVGREAGPGELARVERVAREGKDVAVVVDADDIVEPPAVFAEVERAGGAIVMLFGGR